MNSVYEAEQLIIARIREKVPGLAEVGTVSRYLSYGEVIPTPSAWVRPGQADAIGDPNDGDIQQENQTWQIAICVTHVDDVAQDDYLTSTKTAGELLYLLMQALVGWRPAAGFKSFAYRGRMDPYFEPGYAEFPALFETGFLITGIGD